MGTWSTVIVTFEVDEPQPLEIVHAKTFTPKPILVMLVVSKLIFAIVPLPETTDHEPVPIAALLAAITAFGLLIQSVWFGPAFAVVGKGSTVIVRFETDGGQAALVIVHAKTLLPKPRPVMVVVGEVADVIAPVPETNVQLPVPTAGVFPFSVVEGLLIQMVWLVPASAVVGTWSTVIETVDVDEEQLFVIVHANIFTPNPKLVIVVVSRLTFVIVPLPDTTLHEPVPMAALFAAITTFGLLIQTVWFGPALATVGAGSTRICVVAVEAAQTPLLMVQAKTTIPAPKFVTVVVAEEAEVIVPVPETNDQVPAPTVGTLPIIVAVGAVIQTV